jgi:hypothetical protein
MNEKSDSDMKIDLILYVIFVKRCKWCRSFLFYWKAIDFDFEDSQHNQTNKWQRLLLTFPESWNSINVSSYYRCIYYINYNLWIWKNKTGAEVQNALVCTNAVGGKILISRDVVGKLLGGKNRRWRKFFEITADSAPLDWRVDRCVSEANRLHSPSTTSTPYLWKTNYFSGNEVSCALPTFTREQI